MEEIRDVVWQALTTVHAPLALGDRAARRYPSAVVPFAALREPTQEAMRDLAALLAVEEELFVGWSKAAGPLPVVDELAVLFEITALQMAPASTAADSLETDPRIERLDAGHGPEMVALTDVAFPGFFRPETYRMGRYWGMREGRELVAMAGERLALPGLREISAVCTHPAYTGRGYASALIRHVLRQHQQDGLHSFLHVSDFNTHAIRLYERLGFVPLGATQVTRVRRVT
ncbi:GNAT family N-acetyltransferase [Silvibacterium dinghuense]|uniref:GNAT family N-acetyltransferase n=1 Tax=Silvibacterium dinghuense TaxID=1560006 RepID=A0A4Q1S8Z7_9BACT|nr:GNAT family N-acetyltransferase [Silvibacterium dinghuense]RXS93363.1 GNAT family N-acetyltransferase [Silvibacterium dinghuense]